MTVFPQKKKHEKKNFKKKKNGKPSSWIWGYSLARFCVVVLLLFPDLTLSSFATVSAEVNFFNAVSQAAALMSA